MRPRNGKLRADRRRAPLACRRCTSGGPRFPPSSRTWTTRPCSTLALIENLQRDALSPIDEASGYQRLGVEFKLPHAEIARMVGRNRSTVANLLRLLQLPSEVQAMVHANLSEGHARALLGLEDSERIVAFARDAVEQGWSVREMEARVRGDEPASAPARRPLRGAPKRTARRERGRETGGRCPPQAFRHRRSGDDPTPWPRLLTVSYYSNDDWPDCSN